MVKSVLATVGLAVALVVTSAATSAAGSESTTEAQLAQVRAATAQYHDLDAALADGYRLASPCVPGMGYHYQTTVASDGGQLAATEPNVLVYAPLDNGRMRLVAVEYASWAPATLFGQAFQAPRAGGPPFYTLHAWLWQGNADGVFNATNPAISCDV